MEKKFDQKKIKKLDSPKRRKELPPERVLDFMSIKKDDTVLDIGAGIGYFSIPATKYVENGRIIATDISKSALNEIDNRYELFKEENKDLQLGKHETKLVNNDSLDFKNIDKILMVYVFHELEDYENYPKELYKVLKDNGEITIVDFKKSDLKESEYLEGPPKNIRLDPEDIDKILKDKFIRIEEDTVKNNSYILKYKKV